MTASEQNGAPERANEPVLKWNVTSARPVTVIVEQNGAPERANEPVLKWNVTSARPVTVIVELNRSRPMGADRIGRLGFGAVRLLPLLFSCIAA